MTDEEMTKWINKERKKEVINVGNENGPFLFYMQDKSAQTWGDKNLLTEVQMCIGIVSSVIHVIDKEST